MSQEVEPQPQPLLHCTDKEKCFCNQWLPVIFWNHLLWIYSGESLSAFCNPPFGLRSTWKKYYIHQLYTTAAKVKIFMRNTVKTDFSFTTCFLFVFVYVIPVLPSKFKQGFRGVCFCILTDTLGVFLLWFHSCRLMSLMTLFVYRLYICIILLPV